MITIVKMMDHFMNNLYFFQQKLEVSVKDEKLHNFFLQKYQKRISMNLLTFRKPTQKTIGDAREHGLGASHVESGVGWIRVTPENLCGRAYINLLEFTTQVIQIWLDVIDFRILPQACILTMGYNTESMRWF